MLVWVWGLLKAIPVSPRGRWKEGEKSRPSAAAQGLCVVPVGTCGANLVASATPSQLVCPAFSFEK